MHTWYNRRKEKKGNTTMMTQTIRDMMRRDVHFRERMQDLGYVERPIVAVFDWMNETLETRFGKTIAFEELNPSYIDLFKSSNTKDTKRTPVTEDAAALAKELVDEAPDLGVDKQLNKNYTRDMMRVIFLYEMLLLNELEDAIELTEDEKIHLVGSNQLTQGVQDTSQRLKREIHAQSVANESPKQQADWGLTL